MKIKFLKDYRFIGNDPDDGSDTTVKGLCGITIKMNLIKNGRIYEQD